jgi:hypothetical protein
MTRREFLLGCLTTAMATAIAPSLTDALTGPVEPYTPFDYPWASPANVRVRFTNGEWTAVTFTPEQSRLTGLWVNDTDYSRDPRALTYIQRWLEHPDVRGDARLFNECAPRETEASFQIVTLKPDVEWDDAEFGAEIT